MDTVRRSSAPVYVTVAAALVLAAILSAGIYTAAVVVPSWFASPPASFARIRDDGPGTRLIMVGQLALLVLLCASLALNWRSRSRRNHLLAALGCYLLVWIVSGVYFVPELFAFINTPADAPFTGELAARTGRWAALNWVRALLFVGSEALLLRTLALPPSEPRR